MSKIMNNMNNTIADGENVALTWFLNNACTSNVQLGVISNVCQRWRDVALTTVASEAVAVAFATSSSSKSKSKSKQQQLQLPSTGVGGDNVIINNAMEEEPTTISTEAEEVTTKKIKPSCVRKLMITDMARELVVRQSRQKQNQSNTPTTTAAATTAANLHGNSNEGDFCLAWFAPSGIQTISVSLDDEIDGNNEDVDDGMDVDVNNDCNNNGSFQFDFCGNGESSTAMMMQHESRMGRNAKATTNNNSVTCCTEWRGYRHATEVLAPFGYSTDFTRRVLEKSSELAFGNAISTTTESSSSSSTTTTASSSSSSSTNTPPNKQPKTKSYQYNPTHSVRGATLARPEGFCLCIDNDYIEHATSNNNNKSSSNSTNFTKPAHASQHRTPNHIDEWMNDYDTKTSNNRWPFRKDLGLSPAQRKRKQLNLAKVLLPRMVMSTRRKYPLLHRFAESDAAAAADADADDCKAELGRPLPFERRQRAVQFLNSDRSQAIKLITPAFECGPTAGPVTVFVVGITTEDGCFLSGRSSRFELGHLYPLSPRDMQHDTSPIAIATGKMETATGVGLGGGDDDDDDAAAAVATYGRRSTAGSHNTASSDSDDDNNSSDSERSMHCLCKFDSGDPFNPKDLSIDDPSEDCIHRGCTGPGLWHCYVAVFDGKDSVIRVDGCEEPKRTREHYGLSATTGSDEEDDDDDVDNPVNAGKCVGSGFFDGLSIGSDHQFDMSLCYGEIEGECGQGAIAELAVFKGHMDDSDIETLEKHLMRKHGILSVEEKKEFIARENITRSTTTKNHPLKIEDDLQEDEWKKQANAMIDQRRPWNLVGRMPLRVAANHPSVAWHRTNDITGAPVRISRIGAKSSNGSSDW